ncbi:MAG: hypothetical protein IKN12_12595 [Selenomonadaceae bacterium]|nr:hypothetical protein [Selenomonadaceae bacterium]MBR3723579.1 hypothetical protein [Selenomonadaceae bacterium]
MPATKAPSTAYVFFNCDGEKSLASKNIFYNNAVYGKTQIGRKALWKKIQDEIEAKRVVIAEERMEEAQDAVLKGDPMEAGKLMQFGDIMEIDRY